MGKLDVALYHEDALANHFQVVLPAFPGVLDVTQTSIRVLNCSIPENIINTYDITKGGQTAKRPSGIEGIDKTFSFTYRADKYWLVYKGITAWMNFIRDIRQGTSSPDAIPITGGPSTFRFPITVQTLDANDALTGGNWLFEGAWPTSNGTVDLDENNGDPIEITATFDFLYPNFPTT
jgi:hypothetical protein